MKITPKKIPPLARHCAVVLAFMNRDPEPPKPTRGATRRRNPVSFDKRVWPMFEQQPTVSIEQALSRFKDEKYGTVSKCFAKLADRGTLVRIDKGVYRRAVEGDYEDLLIEASLQNISGRRNAMVQPVSPGRAHRKVSDVRDCGGVL